MTQSIHHRQNASVLSRRSVLKSALAGCCLTGARMAQAQPNSPTSPPAPGTTYDNQIQGIRILPGSWRPHYSWEHIAWISPSWPSQDYIWLDFPEAIFTNVGLIYLSHINPAAPTVFSDLPRVPWQTITDGIECERTLPNSVTFGSRATKRDATTVLLELWIQNGMKEPLKNISLQTCAFLRAIKEFADYTRDNKYVHLPKSGWTPYPTAIEAKDESGPYRIGWRTSGKPFADVSMMITTSNQAERLVAMTWLTDTLSMVSNPGHPCMHADPKFKDLEPGEKQTIKGLLIFHEGPVASFDYTSYLQG